MTTDETTEQTEDVKEVEKAPHEGATEATGPIADATGDPGSGE